MLWVGRGGVFVFTKVLPAIVLTVLLPLPLIAQTYSRVDAYGGYQIQALSDQNRAYDGFKVEVAVNTARHFAFVGEFGYGEQEHGEEGITSTDTKYTYLAGPRFNFPINKVRIFTQVLFGAHHKISRSFGNFMVPMLLLITQNPQTGLQLPMERVLNWRLMT
jgi:hypothetical protein